MVVIDIVTVLAVARRRRASVRQEYSSLVVGRAHMCSLARSVGRSGPEDFVGLTGLAAPALLGWGRV